MSAAREAFDAFDAFEKIETNVSQYILDEKPTLEVQQKLKTLIEEELKPLKKYAETLIAQTKLANNYEALDYTLLESSLPIENDRIKDLDKCDLLELSRVYCYYIKTIENALKDLFVAKNSGSTGCVRIHQIVVSEDSNSLFACFKQVAAIAASKGDAHASAVPAQPSASDGKEATLTRTERFFNFLRRQWKVILLSALIGAGVAAGAALTFGLVIGVIGAGFAVLGGGSSAFGVGVAVVGGGLLGAAGSATVQACRVPRRRRGNYAPIPRTEPPMVGSTTADLLRDRSGLNAGMSQLQPDAALLAVTATAAAPASASGSKRPTVVISVTAVGSASPAASASGADPAASSRSGEDSSAPPVQASAVASDGSQNTPKFT